MKTVIATPSNGKKGKLPALLAKFRAAVQTGKIVVLQRSNHLEILCQDNYGNPVESALANAGYFVEELRDPGELRICLVADDILAIKYLTGYEIHMAVISHKRTNGPFCMVITKPELIPIFGNLPDFSRVQTLVGGWPMYHTSGTVDTVETLLHSLGNIHIVRVK